MKKKGKPIQKVEFKYRIDTGIEVEDLPGMVPKYYEMEACNAEGYVFYGNWQTLTSVQRAEVVAHHYLKFYMEGHREEAATLASEKAQQKAKAKGGRK